jgi:hypothetical protein
MLEHADALEQQLARHGPDESMVRLSLTDDVFLRSSNWARWQLGIPLPVDVSLPLATLLDEQGHELGHPDQDDRRHAIIPIQNQFGAPAPSLGH